MRVIALPICALVILVGAGFFGQGIGLIPGSFMTGSGLWAAIGALMVAAGLAVVIFVARRGSDPE
jgi:hypothetical protein